METVRDVLIILLFLESLIVIGLLIALLLQIMKLVQVVRDDVNPILSDVRQTTSTVKGTARFVSSTTVRPVIRTLTAVTASKRFAQALFRVVTSR